MDNVIDTDEKQFKHGEEQFSDDEEQFSVNDEHVNEKDECDIYPSEGKLSVSRMCESNFNS